MASPMEIVFAKVFASWETANKQIFQCSVFVMVDLKMMYSSMVMIMLAISDRSKHLGNQVEIRHRSSYFANKVFL